jgi:hypothetical protein
LEREEVMATYLALADIDLGLRFPYVLAGTILTDQGPTANIPLNWNPPPCVEPLDAASLAAYFAAGPGPSGPILNHWVGINVPPPATFFLRAVPGSANPTRMYQLTGLGAALAPKLGFS